MLLPINPGEVKTGPSTLAGEAAAGERIIVTNNDVPAVTKPARRNPSGLLKITYIADDFDDVDPGIVLLFEGQ